MIDSKASEVYLQLQLEDCELHQGIPAELKIDISVADSLVIVQKISWEG